MDATILYLLAQLAAGTYNSSTNTTFALLPRFRHLFSCCRHNQQSGSFDHHHHLDREFFFMSTRGAFCNSHKKTMGSLHSFFSLFVFHFCQAAYRLRLIVDQEALIAFQNPHMDRQ